MQLFITDYIHEWDQITIVEERIVQQLSKVLRAKIGDTITVQRPGTRIMCEIISIEKRQIVAKALEIRHIELIGDKMYLAVAMPNKFEKLELIVQKCTEIGVQHLVFFPAKHSVVKEISVSKMERLEKISLEAVEQSRWRNKIEMTFVENIFSLCEWKKIFVAHQDGIKTPYEFWSMNSDLWSIILVGPEGWRHSDEEKIFENMWVEKISLWENILRTETAAIVSWRMMKNIF